MTYTMETPYEISYKKQGFPTPSLFTAGLLIIMIRYEFEYFSFLIIAVLFSAGNAKKNVFTVFTVPIVTIDGFIINLKIWA